jgi:uncharacterized protein YraI
MKKVWAQTARLGAVVMMISLVVGVVAPTAGRAGDTLQSGVTAVIASADGDRVRLRESPGPDADVIALLDEGTSVEIMGEAETDVDGSIWVRVQVNGRTGFVSSSFLGEARIEAKAAGTRYVLERVNLRTGPSTGYRSIAVLAVGTQLSFTGEVQGRFARVSGSAGSGWVAARYIGPVSPGGSGGTGTRYTLDSVRLRTGPGTSWRIITNMPSGAKLSLTGRREGGFAQVSTQWGTGWVSEQYIGTSAPSSGSAGYTNDRVNLRRGPGTSYGVIAALPTGTRLTVTGTERNGFSEVSSGYGRGWVASSYISSVAPQYTGGTRYTIDSVNLRRGPSTGSGVIAVLSSRMEIRFTGTVVNNFGKVSTRSGDGWVSIDYFRKTNPAPSSGSLVRWPVKGGQWRVSQGYNGSSHQNESSAWQYYYSFDLKRTDGTTAWQPVYAPVSGRIRWIDESTGGMSIYMGDGLAFAMFHVLWDNSIREGQSIRQGQYLGVIAPNGRANNGGTAHVHITAWTSSDEGNWSRRAQPFTGRFSISGVSFPSRGRSNDYLNYAFWP